MAKDVRSSENVKRSREMLLDALEGHETGKLRIGTVRDLFRDHLRSVAEARGEHLGTLAGEAG